jgi:anti-sigma regulatory factor (Ser/Thr protein kinase)
LNRRVTGASAHVRFDLESRAENVALIRSAVAAFGAVAELGREQVTDIQTAISEACNNAVLHAYGDELGPMLVTLELFEHRINTSVRDYGHGIMHIGSGDGHMGLGLGIMSALADRFEVISVDDGTEVRMSFKRGPQGSVEDMDVAEPWLREAPLVLDGDAVVWLQPASLLAPIFGRLLRAYAAVSRFTADRADALPEVGAALSEFAAQAGDGNLVGVAIAASSRRLGFVTGPFPNAGHGHGQVRPEARLARLVEELDLARLDGQTILSFTLSDALAATT